MHTISASVIWYLYADLSKLHVLTADIASLGEPLQTLSELVGASVASPSLTSRRPARPRFICGYVCMYVCLYVFLYLGQQFGKRFRRLVRAYVSLKGRNVFEDVRYVQRKTWILFSRRAMQIFVHCPAPLV